MKRVVKEIKPAFSQCASMAERHQEQAVLCFQEILSFPYLCCSKILLHDISSRSAKATAELGNHRGNLADTHSTLDEPAGLSM